LRYTLVGDPLGFAGGMIALGSSDAALGPAEGVEARIAATGGCVCVDATGKLGTGAVGGGMCVVGGYVMVLREEEEEVAPFRGVSCWGSTGGGFAGWRKALGVGAKGSDGGV